MNDVVAGTRPVDANLRTRRRTKYKMFLLRSGEIVLQTEEGFMRTGINVNDVLAISINKSIRTTGDITFVRQGARIIEIIIPPAESAQRPLFPFIGKDLSILFSRRNMRRACKRGLVG